MVLCSLNRTNVEEQLISSSSSSSSGVNYANFCLRLQVAQDEMSRRLFEIFRDGEEEQKKVVSGF